MPAAEVNGLQRKILEHSVRPARRAHGLSGIALRNGRTLPFVVERSWSAPLGVYPEQFFLIDPKSREVLFEGPLEDRQLLGLQAPTVFAETVTTPLQLSAGTYAVVFAIGGVMGGEFPIEAVEVTEEAA